MGTFTNDVVRKRQKHRQTVTVPIIIDEADIDLVGQAVNDAPDSYSGSVTDIAAASGNATINIKYTARGANITDVRHRLDAAGIKYVTKRPSTERLCACTSGDCIET